MGKRNKGRDSLAQTALWPSSVSLGQALHCRKGQLEGWEELAREEGQWRRWPGPSPARARGCLRSSERAGEQAWWERPTGAVPEGREDSAFSPDQPSYLSRY